MKDQCLALLRSIIARLTLRFHHIYACNLPGRVEEYETTFCPHGWAKLIKRIGLSIRSNHLKADGKWPKYGTAVAGVLG